MVDIIFTVILLMVLALIAVVSLIMSTHKEELWDIWVERVSKRGRK